MILIDANLLLYAYDRSSDFHAGARRWLQVVLSKPEPVRLAWTTILAFLRITTNGRAFRHPLSLKEAVAHVDEWLEQPCVDILEPGSRYWPILREILPASQASGTLVSDAHLAALAIEHGATLCTTDRDFTRFEGLSFMNPLSGEG